MKDAEKRKKRKISRKKAQTTQEYKRKKRINEGFRLTTKDTKNTKRNEKLAEKRRKIRKRVLTLKNNIL